MIDWLVQSSTAHSALARGAAPAGLLSPAEQQRLEGLRYARRRRDWLLGRWAAKRLLQRYLARRSGPPVPLDALTIASAPDGSPFVQLCEQAGQSAVLRGAAGCFLPTADCANDLQAALAPLRISISHSGGLALCALADAHAPIGADIERIAPRAPQFAADYFTPGELAQLRAAGPAAHDALVTLIWSAKEAALKALRLGLTVDTRDVEIELGSRVGSRQSAVGSTAGDCRLALGWAPLRACYRPHTGGAPRELHGWWRTMGAYALTLALARAP